MNDTQQNTAQNITVDKKENATVEIAGELAWKDVERHRAAALKTIGENASIPGFRKGKIPEKVLLKHYGEMSLLQEMAERALSEAYPRILREEKIDAIGRPEIKITKLASGNPLGFSVVTAIMPTVELPDYKKIAKDVVKNQEDVKVTDKDVEEGIDHIREQWVKSEKYQKAVQEAEGEPVDPATITAEKDELPEVNDEFVKKLGDFKNLDEFEKRFRENLKTEKKRKAEEKRRMELLDTVTEKASIELPDLLIESELDKMMQQFNADVERAGVDIDEYLKKQDKTREDLRSEWRPDAEKRAKHQLVLNALAAKEEITPDEERVNEEVEKIKEQYKDADELRARTYVATVLTNEKVFEFLEEAGGVKKDAAPTKESGDSDSTSASVKEDEKKKK